MVCRTTFLPSESPPHAKGVSLIRPPAAESSAAAWFCVRSQPKHEHIVAGGLRRLPGVEVFHPHIRQRRITRRGPVWFTEALFPNYVFARFELQAHLHQVRYATGVSNVVHFGDRWPTIAESEIEELRRCMDESEMHTPLETLSPGDKVTIVNKAFYGIPAMVLKNLPAKQRVQVLLEILGQGTVVDVKLEEIVPVQRVPAALQLAAPLPASALG
ncbi:MAG: hypothetical protein HYY24_01940 [Verrucomicrobia bacterium]|nr:hypothetical protein [Verrucomicrobiota bacterium]